MDTRSKYKTKQRERLLRYFEEMAGVHVTAADVCEYMKKQDAPIGQSTVYRQLESMVDEGVIKKYIIDANSPACFEYVDPESHEEGEVCFHCKCEKCGKLIHLHSEELEEVQGHILDECHFKIDPTRTVFYGICDNCS